MTYSRVLSLFRSSDTLDVWFVSVVISMATLVICAPGDVGVFGWSRLCLHFDRYELYCWATLNLHFETSFTLVILYRCIFNSCLVCSRAATCNLKQYNFSKQFIPIFWICENNQLFYIPIIVTLNFVSICELIFLTDKCKIK